MNEPRARGIHPLVGCILWLLFVGGALTVFVVAYVLAST